MPIVDPATREYDAQTPLTANWDNFRRGLNTLLADNEIDDDELAQARNIVLVGKGSPTKRWGYEKYFLSSATGSVRGLFGYYLSNGSNELISITDEGFLTIKSGTSYTARAGASWASGYNADMTQIDDDVYIVNGQREVVRYSTPTLSGFPTISKPTGTFATQWSGASGFNTYAYRVTSVSKMGETLATDAVSVVLQPQDLTEGAIMLSWTGASAASGDLIGYNVYGRLEDDITFLARVEKGVTQWLDDGSSIQAGFTYPPLSDTTGGIVAKYIERFDDRLVYAGIPGEPTKVVVTGRVPNHERFDLASGGNFVRLEPDGGDDITGLGVFGGRIIVFKEKSIWEITLGELQIGNFYVTIPQAKMITRSRGCISAGSVVAVENDIFFLSRDGVYVLGYEPNLAIDVLRTNELSAKIRPDFQSIGITNMKGATAVYFETKYIISFPGSNKSYVYDRERLSWVGPWTFDTRVFLEYFDSSDERKLIFGDDDGPQTYNMDETIMSDDGSAIPTDLKTRKTDFGDWSIFKTINDMYSAWSNVSGTISVNIELEDRDGTTTAAKEFTLTTAEATSGWGSSLWGNAMWGDSSANGVVLDTSEIVRWIKLNKTARRMQVYVSTNRKNSNYELLSLRTLAKPIGRGMVGSGWRV